VYLLSAYPALVVGAVAGFVVARRQWPVWPVLAMGSVVFVALVLHQSTVPRVSGLPFEHPQITPFIWGLFAIVNSASWALGVGIGLALNSRLSTHPVS
jgi:hypothetical protein